MSKQYHFNFYNYEFPRIGSYERAKELYENTAPIRGKLRGDLNLRPLGRRRSSGVSFIQENNNCYTAKFSYSLSRWGVKYAKNNPGKSCNGLYDLAINFYRNKIVINYASILCVEAIALLAAVLPPNVKLVRINNKMYLETNRGFFWLVSNRDLILRLKEDGWQVANPIQEKITKPSDTYRAKVKKQFAEFFGWAQKMWPFIQVEPPDLTAYRRRRYSYVPPELKKDVELLTTCKDEAVKYDWNYQTSTPEVHPLAFTEWKTKCKLALRRELYKQALKCKRTSRTEKIPIGIPAPRY